MGMKNMRKFRKKLFCTLLSGAIGREKNYNLEITNKEIMKGGK